MDGGLGGRRGDPGRLVFNFQRADTGEQLFGITLFGHRVTGSGIDENALVAIFRAYILLRMEEEQLTRGRDIL